MKHFEFNFWTIKTSKLTFASQNLRYASWRTSCLFHLACLTNELVCRQILRGGGPPLVIPLCFRYHNIPPTSVPMPNANMRYRCNKCQSAKQQIPMAGQQIAAMANQLQQEKVTTQLHSPLVLMTLSNKELRSADNVRRNV